MTWELLDRIGLLVIALAFVSLLFLPRFAPRRAPPIEGATLDGGPYRTSSPCEPIMTTDDSAAVRAAFVRAADRLAQGKIDAQTYEIEIIRLTGCLHRIREFREASKRSSS